MKNSIFLKQHTASRRSGRMPNREGGRRQMPMVGKTMGVTSHLVKGDESVSVVVSGPLLCYIPCMVGRGPSSYVREKQQE